MSTKIQLTSGDDFCFYHNDIFALDSNEITNAFIELTEPKNLRISRESLGKPTPLIATMGIPAEAMDQIARAWIKERKLYD